MNNYLKLLFWVFGGGSAIVAGYLDYLVFGPKLLWCCGPPITMFNAIIWGEWYIRTDLKS